MTRDAQNLRKLLTAVVPVDGTSALMHAIRHKGAELVLANFIPYGNPVRYIARCVVSLL